MISEKRFEDAKQSEQIVETNVEGERRRVDVAPKLTHLDKLKNTHASLCQQYAQVTLQLRPLELQAQELAGAIGIVAAQIKTESSPQS